MKVKDKAKKVALHVWEHKWTYVAIGVAAVVTKDNIRLRKFLNKSCIKVTINTAKNLNTNAVASFREDKNGIIDGLKNHVLDDMKEGTDLTGVIFYTKKDQ